jgi:hypothetical protein
MHSAKILKSLVIEMISVLFVQFEKDDTKMPYK